MLALYRALVDMANSRVGVLSTLVLNSMVGVLSTLVLNSRVGVLVTLVLGYTSTELAGRVMST